MGGEDRSTRNELRKESRSSGQQTGNWHTQGEWPVTGRSRFPATNLSGSDYRDFCRPYYLIKRNKQEWKRRKQLDETVCFNWTARVGVRFPARSPCREMKSFKLRLLFHPLFPRNFSHRLQRTENTGGELDLASQPQRREQSISTCASSIRSCTYFESMHTNLCYIVRSGANDIG